MVPGDFTDEAALLAADVIELEGRVERLEQQLRIALEMLSVTLDISHQAIAHIAKLAER